MSFKPLKICFQFYSTFHTIKVLQVNSVYRQSDQYISYNFSLINHLHEQIVQNSLAVKARDVVEIRFVTTDVYSRVRISRNSLRKQTGPRECYKVSETQKVKNEKKGGVAKMSTLADIRWSISCQMS